MKRNNETVAAGHRAGRKTLFRRAWKPAATVFLFFLFCSPAHAVQDGVGNEIIPVDTSVGNRMDVGAGKFVVEGDTGNVGINSTVPRAKLDVEGSVYFGNGNIGVGSSAPRSMLDVMGTVTALAFSGDGSGLTGVTGGSQWTTSGAAIYYNTGNVGIGTSVPNGKLEMGATAGLNSVFYLSDNDITTGLTSLYSDNAYGTLQQILDNSGGLLIAGNVSTGYNTANALEFWGNLQDANNTGSAIVLRGNEGNGGGNVEALGSNELVLQVYNYTTPLLSILGNGNFGIGSVAPQQKVDVVGTVKATAFIGDGSGLTGLGGSISGLNNGYITRASSSTTITDSLIYQSAGNNIGIGTSAPGGKLVIYGGNVGIGTENPESKLQIRDTSFVELSLRATSASAGNVERILFGDGNGSARGMISYTSSGAGNDYMSLYTNVAERVRIDNQGNVGIGSVVPQAKLDVEGSAYFGNGNVGIGSSAPTRKLEIYNDFVNVITPTGNEVSGYMLESSPNYGLFKPLNSNNILLLNSPATISMAILGSEKVQINSNGNVGINSSVPQARLDVEGSAYFGNGNIGVGSSAPSQKVDVVGTVRATAFIGDGSGLTGLPAAGGWSRAGANIYPTVITDNVGIGSSAPVSRLDLVGAGATSATASLIVRDSAAGVNMIVRDSGYVGIGTSVPLTPLEVRSSGAAPGSDVTANFINVSSLGSAVQLSPTNTGGVSYEIGASADGAASIVGSGGRFYVYNVVSGAVPMVIDSSGNVGIGTVIPLTSRMLIQQPNAADSFRVNDAIGDTTPFLIDQSGNVGLGSSVPQAKLDVEGGVYVGNGNIGVGTSAPVARLEVNGQIALRSASGGNVLATNEDSLTLMVDHDNDQAAAVFRVNLNGGFFYGSGNSLLYVTETGEGGFYDDSPDARFEISADGTANDLFMISSTDDSNGDRFVVRSSGNVGIGSSVPTQKVDVTGTVKATAFIGDGSGLTGISSISGLTPGKLPKANTATSLNDSEIYQSPGSNVGIGTTAPNGKLIVYGGNVGIGSTNPGSALDVGGYGPARMVTTIVGGFAANSNAISGIEMGNFSAGNTAEFRFSVQSDNSHYLAFTMPSSGNTGTLFGMTRSTAAYLFTNQIAGGGRHLALGPVTAHNLVFGTNNTERMRVDSGGNVGINSTVPQAKLDVEGSAYFGNGNIGVGSSAPSQKVDVVGTVKATAFIGDGSGLAGIASAGGWTDSGTSVFNTTTTDNVGVGTSVPAALFAVGTTSQFQVNSSGTVSMPSPFTLGGTSVTSTGTQLNYLNAATGTTGTASTNVVFSSGPTISNPVITNISPGADFTLTQNAVAPLLSANTGALANTLVLRTGNVGIGTSVPQAALAVGATGQFQVSSAGSVTSGTWSGTAIGNSRGGTGQDSSGWTGVAKVSGGTWAQVLGTAGYHTRWTGDANVLGNALVYDNGTNVGIGSTVPQQKLEVAGTVRATAFIGDGAGITGITGLMSGLNAGYIPKSATATSINDSQIYQSPGSNIGIGTSTPNGKLIIHGGNVGIGSTNPNYDLTINGYTYTSQYFITGNNSLLGAGQTLRTTAGGKLTMGSGASDHVVIDTNGYVGINSTVPQARLDVEGSVYVGNGNVGIGTSLPQAMLDVAGTVTSLWFISPMHSAGSYAYSNAGYYYSNINRDGITAGTITAGGAYPWIIRSGNGTYTDGYITFETGGQERVRLDAAGNVGVSTSVPLGKLIVQGAGTTTGITFATQNSAATRLVTMLDSGNVGIGTSVPQVKLQSLATTEQLRLNYDATNYNAFTVGATGSLTVAATGTNPDIRLTPGGTGYTILDGNVGISTSVPLGKLIVQGAGTTTGITFATQNSAATRLVTMLDSGNVGIGSTAPMARMVIWGAGTTSSTSSFMVRDSAGTGRLTVQDGGNVGVGTSVPTSTLQVVTTGTLGIPVGTGPTTATAGQIAIDTTDDQFLYYGAATRVLSYKQSRAFTIEYPLDTDNFLLFKTFDPITITDIECIVDPTDSGDSVVITIQERDSAGINPGTVEAVTCDYNGASDDGTFTDSAIAANGWVGVDIGTVTGAVGQLVVTVYYTINAE